MINANHSDSLIGHQRALNFDDIFLASYPRSGNTWMRLLLSDLILQKHGFETDTELPILASQIIPGIYENNIRFDTRIQLSYRVVKTHWFYAYMNEVLARPSWMPKVIYLFRNPADVLCSFYHLELYEAERNSSGSKVNNLNSIEEFCLNKVDRWCKHLEGYIYAKESNREQLLFISYENMHKNLISILKCVMAFIGFSIDETMAKKAILNHRFEKKKAQDPTFFRKGKIGSSKEELSSEVLALIEEKTTQIYNMAKELEFSSPQKG